MPGKMSNYLENLVVDKVLSNGTLSPNATVYLGLCTAFTESSDGDTFTEVTTTNTAYQRTAVIFGTSASGGSISNTAKVAFPTANPNTWGTPTHWIICDAQTNGNVLYWGTITTPLSVLHGEQVEIAIGQLSISLTGNMAPTLANQILNCTLKNTAISLTKATHVGLLSAYTDESTFTEVADGNYARQSATWNAVSGGSSANSAQIQWSAAAGDYAVNYVSLHTALTNGSLLWYKTATSAPITVQLGKNFRFEVGALTVTVD